MNIRKNTTVYSCEFCKKRMFTKNAMIKHELWCDRNPSNSKACSGCIHIKEIEVEIYHDDPRGRDITRKHKGLYCTKLDKKLYPLKVQRKGWDKIYETFSEQEPMPKECSDWSGGDLPF